MNKPFMNKNFMKKSFMTGLVILLPILMTLILVRFFVALLAAPFMWITISLFSVFGILEPNEGALFISQLITLFALFGLTLLTGFLGHTYLIRPYFKFFDKLLSRIPFISQLYSPLKQAFYSIFNEKSSSFSQAVLVPYPFDGCRAMGFLMQGEQPDVADRTYAVFVPGVPNPTFGFLMTYKREQLIFLDIEVSKALKFVVSCGVIYEK